LKLEDLLDRLPTILVAFGGAVGAAASFLAGRARVKRTSRRDAFEMTWQLVEGLREEVLRLRKENQELASEISRLRDQNEALMATVNSLRARIAELERKIPPS
jgi:predicted RNase H-like nuclease (RuvC/YqgF family)